MNKLEIVLVGPSGVGKTSLVNRFTRNLFSKSYINTVGCDIYVKSVDIQGVTYKLAIHDIGGQLELREFRRKCLENADAVMVVFAVNDRETQDLGAFIADVLAMAEKPTWIIVGNKTDAVEMGAVDLSLTIAIAKEHGVPLVFTSAKDGTNVQAAFLGLVEGHITRRDG